MNTKKALLLSVKDLAIYDEFFLWVFQEITEMSHDDCDRLLARLQGDTKTLALRKRITAVMKYGEPETVDRSRDEIKTLFTNHIFAVKSDVSNRRIHK